MESISEKIRRLYEQFNGVEDGYPGTRYKSWEHCHKEFKAKKELYENATDESQKQSIKYYLSVHLFVYLASWGMYRGSSFLLQRDYHAHDKVVEEILNEKYDTLWDFNPCDSKNDIDKICNLIFEIYNFIEKAYHLENDESSNRNDQKDDVATDTLVTKILLGTFGCVPAFDRYVKKAIGKLKKTNIGKKVIGRGENGYGITQTISKNTFKGMVEFVKDNSSEFVVKDNNGEDNKDYPPMKCLDMYLWEIGMELEIMAVLENDKNNKKGNPEVSNEKKKELLKKAQSIKIVDSTLNPNDKDAYSKAANEIRESCGFTNNA